MYNLQGGFIVVVIDVGVIVVVIVGHAKYKRHIRFCVLSTILQPAGT